MSFNGDSSDPEWKEAKMKLNKTLIKQELNASLNRPKYSQKFCDKWLNIFHPWLARCDDDANKPFCRACQCRLDCNRCHLQRHERTSKHARNLEILVNKGEGAARQNLSIRQERSKYYQQRKKLNSSMASSHDASDLGMDTADDYIEEYVMKKKPAGKADPDAETAFQFVQTEAAPGGDQYTEETIMKQEIISADGNDPLPTRPPKNVRGGPKRNNVGGGGGGVTGIVANSHGHGIKKERVKLLMQIQKDKNELMDSFKELMSSTYQSSPPREKNHVDLFFESVSSSVKALSPKLIAETKMRVSQLICELELRALTENDVNTSGPSATAVVVSPDSGGTVGGTYIIGQPVAAVHAAQHHQVDGGDQHYEALS